MNCEPLHHLKGKLTESIYSQVERDLYHHIWEETSGVIWDTLDARCIEAVKEFRIFYAFRDNL